MRAHELNTTDITEDHIGWIPTESIRTQGGKRLLAKGEPITRQAFEQWSDVGPETLHLIELDPDDLHENDAGRRICAAVAGEGIRVEGPFHSRYNLIAEQRGVLHVNRDLLDRINRVGGPAVFSLYDRQPVLADKTVAGVKVVPIAIPEAKVAEVERLCREAAEPVVAVAPFVPRRVYVIATEVLHEKLRQRFQEKIEHKVGWYGSEVLDVRFVDAEPDQIAGAFRDGLDQGADVFLAAGGNTLDPLDPLFLALPKFGGEMLYFGAPADPGTMFWLATVGDTPIFNLASCSMYSEATVVDLMLPLAMTGHDMRMEDVAELGYGGLLEDEMHFRFPDYDADENEPSG